MSFSENATAGDELAWEGEHSPVAPGHPAAGWTPQEGSGMEMTGSSETKLGFTSLRNPPKEWNKGLISHFGFCMCPEEAPLP